MAANAFGFNGLHLPTAQMDLVYGVKLEEQGDFWEAEFNNQGPHLVRRATKCLTEAPTEG